MKEALNLSCHYKVYLDTVRHSYTFQTDSGAKYELLFMLGNEVFISTKLQNQKVYQIYINKLQDGSGGADKEIALTVDSIINHFFIDSSRILIYSCDGLDKRELARLRLFNRWYSLSPHKKELVKLDGDILDGEYAYYSSLIYHSNTTLDTRLIKQAYYEVIQILRDHK